MRDCLGEELLQSYIDGELDPVRARNVTGHLVRCRECAQRARAVENESRLVSEILRLDVEVPTERLRRRLQEKISAIESDRQKSAWMPFARPALMRSLGAMALATICAVAFFWLAQRRPDSTRSVTPAERTEPSAAAISSGTPERDELRARPASAASRPHAVERAKTAQRPKSERLLEDENRYLHAIAKLSAAVDAKPEVTAQPSVRTGFEKNMLVVDQAITAAREAVRRNPQDQDARALLRSAYQSKVELLSMLAEEGGVPRR